MSVPELVDIIENKELVSNIAFNLYKLYSMIIIVNKEKKTNILVILLPRAVDHQKVILHVSHISLD